MFALLGMAGHRPKSVLLEFPKDVYSSTGSGMTGCAIFAFRRRKKKATWRALHWRQRNGRRRSGSSRTHSRTPRRAERSTSSLPQSGHCLVLKEMEIAWSLAMGADISRHDNTPSGIRLKRLIAGRLWCGLFSADFDRVWSRAGTRINVRAQSRCGPTLRAECAVLPRADPNEFALPERNP